MSYRIAMVGACPYPVPQGSQVLLKATAQALQRRGHDVRLVVYGYGLGEDDSGVSIRRAWRVPLAHRTAAGPSPLKPLLDLALAAELARVIRTEDISIVHAHNYEGLMVALAVGKRPIVYHAHNAMADELPHYFHGAAWAQDVGRRLDRNLPCRADRVIAPHAALADYLSASGCARERIDVIAPSVDGERFSPTDVEDTLPAVLYSGNLDAYQNLGLLSEAMELVRQRLPEACLLVATADRRKFPGVEKIPTPDFDSMRQALARDVVFACPRVSWSGYPMKLLNAMAAGKASVACRSAAHPLHDGVTGLVVQDNDAEAFADALLRLLKDPALRQTLGRAARTTALNAHHPDTIAACIEETYARAIATAPAHP
ncbi:MAG: glycosyltransferase family 4 protein [FCB group bacterium]|jgi:glycosyltransferase involved in cell wall biosynthesis|nr:glycosyltransferase family 4 protein [FCB group bacterium]